MRERLLIIDNAYPHEKNLYGDVFVQTRVKEYQKHHDCLIVSFTAESDFEYAGASVKACTNGNDFKKVYSDFKPTRVLVHFLTRWMIDEIMPLVKTPIFVWVHGFEVQSWKRRLFNYNLAGLLNPNFLRVIKDNKAQRKAFGSFINESNSANRPVHLVFVSNWIKQVCEKDTGAALKRYSIIPNPIDTELFDYQPKGPEMRKKLLSIRPFHTRKYANDITLEALLKCSNKPWFKELEVNIYGEGAYFSVMQERLKNLPNVKMHNGFLRPAQMKALYDQNGICICPTRQDTHGVTMCESMSSGLVPLSSLNSAIPEYVQDGKTGFTTTGSDDLAAKIELLVNDADRFTKMSKQAATSIRELCGIEMIMQKELNLLGQRSHKISSIPQTQLQ